MVWIKDWRNATSHMPNKLTPDILNAAIEGFESEKRRLDEQIAELRQMLNGNQSQAEPAQSTKRLRRKMSAAARARIAEAQRRRWAQSKKSQSPSKSPSETSKPKRRLSAAGRKRIAEATKARWARIRAEAARGAKAGRSSSKKKAGGKKTVAKAAKAAASKRSTRKATSSAEVAAPVSGT
jgi:hypothetical protein